MATMQGITGKLSGKMGAAVFRVREGQQVVSQYNPIVKNPNTAGQQSQRAKFKLMSQLAAVMAPAMGSFIIKVRKEGGKQSQRNAFVQNNFPLVEVSSDNERVIAKIPMDKVKLTSSNRYLGTIAKDGLNVVVTTEDAAIERVQFVEINYIDNDLTRPVLVNVEVVSAVGSQFSYGPQSPSGQYTILAFGLIPTSAASRASLDNLHTPATDDYTAAVILNNLVSDGSIVETVTLGINGEVE